MPILGKAVLWLLIVDTSETRSSIAVCIKWITAGCAEENLRVTALSAAVTSFFKERRCTWWLYLRIGDNRTNVRCGNTKMKVFIMLSFLLFAKMSLKLSLKFVSLFSHLVNFIFLLLMNMQSCISYIIMAGCSVAQSCLTLCDPMDCSLPGDFPGKNTGVGCPFLSQGIFLTQGSNLCLLCLLHWQDDSLPLSHLGNSVGWTGPPNVQPLHSLRMGLYLEIRFPQAWWVKMRSYWSNMPCAC